MYYRAQKNPTKQIKIAITGGLGDSLLATPFIRYFKTCGRYDRIVCCVTQDSIEMFDTNPYIDQIVPCTGNQLFLWAAPEKDSDVFSPYLTVPAPESIGAEIMMPELCFTKLNLQSVPVIKQVADLHGIKLTRDAPDIFLDQGDEQWAEEFMGHFDTRPVVLLNRESRLNEKNAGLSVFMKIEQKLSADVSVMTMESNRLTALEHGVDHELPGLRKSAALFKRLSCVVTVDSFPGHLAFSVGTPAVVIFGPSNPGAFGHKSNVNIRTDRCTPPCADTGRREACKKSECLEDLPVDLIVDSVRRGLRV